MFPQDTHRHPFIHIGILLSCMSIKLSVTMRPSHLAHCMGPSSIHAGGHATTPTPLLNRQMCDQPLPVREQVQCHGRCCNCLRVLPVNRRVRPNNIRLYLFIRVSHWLHAAKRIWPLSGCLVYSVCLVCLDQRNQLRCKSTSLSSNTAAIGGESWH